MSELKAPPYSKEAEAAVLGCILIDDQSLPLVLDLIDTSDFYVEVHRRIFLVMKSLVSVGSIIDTNTLLSRLKHDDALEEAGGVHGILELTSCVNNASQVRIYAEIVKDKSALRQMLKISSEIQHKAFGDIESIPDYISGIEQRMGELSRHDARKSYHCVKDVVEDTMAMIGERHERGSEVVGVTSGFTDLDEMTAGLQKGDLVILAARPSMGKTALALNITTAAALHAKVPTVFFSLEMGREQLVSRILCSESRVDSTRLRKGCLQDAEWGRLIQGAGTLSGAPIYIDDTPALSVMRMQAKARRIKVERGLGMIVVDYLQLMKADGNIRSREQAISEISRSLKAIAKELDVPVLALSQLNRGVDGRPDKRPMPSDLRESGAIEQDADVIMFIYRDEVYNKETTEKGIAEVLISKQRNGATGTVKLKWFGHFTRFENLARTPDMF